MWIPSPLRPHPRRKLLSQSVQSIPPIASKRVRPALKARMTPHTSDVSRVNTWMPSFIHSVGWLPLVPFFISPTCGILSDMTFESTGKNAILERIVLIVKAPHFHFLLGSLYSVACLFLSLCFVCLLMSALFLSPVSFRCLSSCWSSLISHFGFHSQRSDLSLI